MAAVSLFPAPKAKAKTFLYVGLFGLFFWQLHEADRKLQTGQLATKISYMTESSVQVPSITMCRIQIFLDSPGSGSSNKTLAQLMAEAKDRPLIHGGYTYEDSFFSTIVESNKWYDIIKETKRG